MAPAHAIDGPDAHDHATKQLAPELTIDGPQQDGYSPYRRERRRCGESVPACHAVGVWSRRIWPIQNSKNLGSARSRSRTV
ncbi:hypothetical protein CIK79_00835 [Brevibacterium aurantiacum]|uniref:Uncharacterized protein n=1 Tax=Brevibacterium aurantiacum TaxID=273384 RepID=A0A2A3WZM9_BREAU|nr:hypothetical protein CIK79_00835 [Brevibacterium aurantiacum]